jgi:hypothetical protein
MAAFGYTEEFASGIDPTYDRRLPFKTVMGGKFPRFDAQEAR